MGSIYHWCPKPDWERAGSEYAAPDLATDGFIHCSYRDQIEETATAVDRGRDDLVLLCIDETGLPIRVEDCYDTGEPYPHVYGAIPVQSITAVEPFPPSPDGSFTLPPNIPG